MGVSQKPDAAWLSAFGMTAVILRRSGSAIAISWRLKYRRSLVQCGVNLHTLGPHP